MDIKLIAEACHEGNRVVCLANGDDTQKHWEEAEDWQKDSAVKGVQFRLDNPDATPESQHEAWCKDKTADGWVFGDVKDADNKIHPCILPYAELPEAQKVKDRLFCAIVDALK